jgi:hypothetical protein
MMPFHVAAMLMVMLMKEERSTNRRGVKVDFVRVRVVNITAKYTFIGRTQRDCGNIGSNISGYIPVRPMTLAESHIGNKSGDFETDSQW